MSSDNVRLKVQYFMSVSACEALSKLVNPWAAQVVHIYLRGS